MTSKEIKKYNLILEIGRTDPTSEKMIELIISLAGVDFQTAVDMWEFIMGKYEDLLSKQETSYNLEGRVFAGLSGVSDTKLKQLITDNAPLLKLIYGNAATAGTGANLSFLVQIILASKIEKADEILKHIATNKNKNMEFGDRMKIIVDEVFNQQCQKAGTKVPTLNRRQTMLLLEYALKIKGPNKNLLVQRIKELQ
ncbi:MAG: hypothetical protein FWE16_03440 [Firmicutes bacterium]|nr:hypothetical protein [Bacillota bacterium]